MHGIWKEKWTLIHFVLCLMFVKVHIREFKKIDKLNH